MSKIRSGDTKPEIIVRSLLHVMGYRFRLHQKKLPGKPDIVLRRFNTVIFVNGCFGTTTKIAKDQIFQNPIVRIGRGKFIKMSQEIKKILRNWGGWGGR